MHLGVLTWCHKCWIGSRTCTQQAEETLRNDERIHKTISPDHWSQTQLHSLSWDISRYPTAGKCGRGAVSNEHALPILVYTESKGGRALRILEDMGRREALGQFQASTLSNLCDRTSSSDLTPVFTSPHPRLKRWKPECIKRLVAL